MKVRSLAITFYTQGDDKDQNNTVYIAIDSGGKQLAAVAVGSDNTWRDNTECGPYGVWLDGDYESEDLQLRMNKTGGGEWRLRVKVEGVYDKGSGKKTVLDSSGLIFTEKDPGTVLNLHK